MAAVLVTAAGIGVAATRDPFVTALALVVVLLLAPLAWRLVNGAPIHPLEPLWPFLLCYAISFVLKPMLVVEGTTTYASSISRPDAAAAVVWTAVALVCVYLGYFSPLGRPLVAWSRGLEVEHSLMRLRAGAVLLALGGFSALVMAVRLYGSIPSLAAIFSEGFRSVFFSVLSGRGYLSLLLALSLYAPAVQAYVAVTSRRRADALLTVALTVLVAAVAVVFYSRTMMLQVVIMLLVVLHFRGRWFSPRTLMVSGLALLLVGGALGLRRAAGFESVWAAIASPLQAVRFLTHSFDSFEFLVPALERTSMFGALAGRSLVEDLFWTYVPRAMVPWKPVDYGAVRVQYLLMPETTEAGAAMATYPAGFLAEWYVNFGVFGLVTIGILYGMILRVARTWVFTPDPKLLPLLVYGGIVLNLVGLFRSSSQLLISAVVTMVILYVLFGRAGTPGADVLRSRRALGAPSL